MALANEFTLANAIISPTALTDAEYIINGQINNNLDYPIDNGFIGDGSYTPITGGANPPLTQVFTATHYGKDREYIKLPSYRRSFISFSFGGKDIEDFNLLACSENNGLTRPGYASFEDLVTSYDIMDGQYYHGTHYKPNTISFKLVTDAMEENMLNDFLHWFQGGCIRELILAEHPNRAIMARVSEPPQLELQVYEKPIRVRLGQYLYTTSTTLYKGFINVSFTADTPFWYAKQSVLVRDTNNIDTFLGIDIHNTDDYFRDVLKIIYEDRIPSLEVIGRTMHFGSGEFAIIGDAAPYSLVMSPINPQDPTATPEDWAILSTKSGYFIYHDPELGDIYVQGARAEATGSTDILGRVAGPTIADEEKDFSATIVQPNVKDYYFFYGGTAPAPTILSFTVNIKPTGGSQYINCIANSYESSALNYSTVTIRSIHTKEFSFTTPNILTSWNKAYKIFDDIVVNETRWDELSDTLRDQVRHPAVRAWAVCIVSYLNYLTAETNTTYINDNGSIKNNGKTLCKTYLRRFFQEYENDDSSWSNARFVFNAETGTATGTFRHWVSTDSNRNIVADVIGNDLTHAQFESVTENVGDMLRSNWLLLEDRNSFDPNGLIVNRTDEHPEYSHELWHNLTVGLTDFTIQYKHMYL